MRDLKALRTALEAKRKQMIESGIRLGLSHPETVKLSQEVDELHNEHMRIERRKKVERKERTLDNIYTHVNEQAGLLAVFRSKALCVI